MNEVAYSTHRRIAHARQATSPKHLAVSFIRANSQASAETQRRLCSQRAESIGLHITHEFAVIGVDSGHTAAIEALVGLFYYLNKNPRVSHLITADYSRLTRHGKVFAVITDILDQLEVSLTTSTEIIHFPERSTSKEA